MSPPCHESLTVLHSLDSLLESVAQFIQGCWFTLTKEPPQNEKEESPMLTGLSSSIEILV
jgi:hypothetical protein